MLSLSKHRTVHQPWWCGSASVWSPCAWGSSRNELCGTKSCWVWCLCHSFWAAWLGTGFGDQEWNSSRYQGVPPCPGWLWQWCSGLILTKGALFFLKCVQKREAIWSLLSTRCLAFSYSSTISACFHYLSLGCLFKVNRTFFTVLAVLSKPWHSLIFNFLESKVALNIQDYPELVSVLQEQKEASLWNWMGTEVVQFKFSNFPLQSESDCLSLNKL